MPLFSYKAVDASGKNVLGRVEAVNLFDLEQRLARMGLDLVSGAPSQQRTALLPTDAASLRVLPYPLRSAR